MESVDKAFESLISKGLIEVFRVNGAAAVQGDTKLFLIESDIVLAFHFLIDDRVKIQEVFDAFPTDDILFDDALAVADFDGVIESIFRIYLHEWALRAEAKAPDDIDRHFIFELFLFDEFF